MNIAYGGYSFLHEQSIIINYGVTNIYDTDLLFGEIKRIIAYICDP